MEQPDATSIRGKPGSRYRQGILIPVESEQHPVRTRCLENSPGMPGATQRTIHVDPAGMGCQVVENLFIENRYMAKLAHYSPSSAKAGESSGKFSSS